MSSWIDFLKSSVSPTSSSAGIQRSRVPFKFTSDYNLARAVAPRSATNNIPTVITPNVSITPTLSNTQDNAGVVNMLINPRSIHWTQPKRFAKRDTMDGSTYMHFLNSKLQNNDIPRIEFEGTTGNISLKGSDLPSHSQVGNTNGYAKALVFHKLWNLTRQPILYFDSNPNVQKFVSNKQYIIYESPLLPFSVTLTGLYESVLDFTESSDKPNQVSYRFAFVVLDTIPDIDTMVNMLQDGLLPPTP